jgi:hypothetical protein
MASFPERSRAAALGHAVIHQLEKRFVLIAATAALLGYGGVYAFDLAWPPIRSDGFSYYVYLPAWFIHHDPTLEKTAADWGAGTLPSYSQTFRFPATGHWVNPHPIGEAVLLVPFFLAADALTRWSNLSRDGFSIYYQYAAGVAGVFYFAGGLTLLRRTLRRRFSEGVTLATLVCIVWATDLYHYATYDSVFSHVFSFFLLAAFLEIGMEWLSAPASAIRAALIGAIAGLIILVRHTDGLMLLFLTGLAIESGQVRARWQEIAIAGVMMVALLIPQLLIYRYATGQWLFSPYGPNGHFAFSSPQIIPVLIGTKKGLLFWSPILILSLAGIPLMRRHFPGLFVPTLIVLPLTLLLVASWSDWQMGGSFGHRGFTDLMPIFAIALASFFEWSGHKRWAPVVVVVASLAVALSVAQMIQYWLRIIPFSDTSWALYKSVFLKFSR